MVLQSELEELNVKKTNRDECQIFELEVSKPPFDLSNYGICKTYKPQFNMKISTSIRTFNNTYKEYKEFYKFTLNMVCWFWIEV